MKVSSFIYVFEPFLKGLKNDQNRTKSKGLPLTLFKVPGKVSAMLCYIHAERILRMLTVFLNSVIKIQYHHGSNSSSLKRGRLSCLIVIELYYIWCFKRHQGKLCDANVPSRKRKVDY